jgi:D-methionine transport system permease protein
MTAISLIGYSAMAGVVGGGGIGFLAINYGYYRYETGVMIITVILLILIVQSVQSLGDSVSNNVDRKKK